VIFLVFLPKGKLICVLTCYRIQIPFKFPPYRMALTVLKELKTQLKDLQDKNFNRPSICSRGAPFFGEEERCALRMCVDYCKLHKVTITKKYPMHRIDNLFDKLQREI